MGLEPTAMGLIMINSLIDHWHHQIIQISSKYHIVMIVNDQISFGTTIVCWFVIELGTNYNNYKPELSDNGITAGCPSLA